MSKKGALFVPFLKKSVFVPFIDFKDEGHGYKHSWNEGLVTNDEREVERNAYAGCRTHVWWDFNLNKFGKEHVRSQFISGRHPHYLTHI